MRLFIARNTKGFTFVEVLIAVAIVAVLSTVIYSTMGGARKKSRDTARVSDIAELQLALRLYRDSNETYPSYPYGTVIGGGSLDTALLKYLPAVPRDPMSASGATFQYVYDSYFWCSNLSKHVTVLYVKNIEVPATANWQSVCGSPVSGIPIANTYGVVISPVSVGTESSI